MIYLKLFWAFVKVAFFSVGGTYSFIPMIEREIVEGCKWMDKGEFLNILGMVKVLPGAISVQFATYVGYKIAGFLGAVSAILGNILPPAIFISLALRFYNKDIQWVKNGFDMVKVTIAVMVVMTILKIIDYRLIANIKGFIVLISTILLFLLTKIHPAFIIIAAYIFGALYG